MTLDKIAGSELTDPIFIVSALEGDLATKELPPMFKAVIDRSYYKVPSVNVKPGLQVYSKIKIGGVLGSVLKDGMGLPVNDFTMRAGVTGDAPSTPRSTADARDKVNAQELFSAAVKKGIEDKEKRDKKAADDLKRQRGQEVEEEKEKKELFVELQMAPGAKFAGPLKMSAITLSDVTLFLNNKGKVGYKGNAVISGVADGKPILAFYEGPIAPSGALNLKDANLGFAAPSLTGADIAKIGLAVGPAGLISGIDALAPGINAMSKPLSVIVLRNPQTVPVYKVGGEWPDIAKFQVVAVGPLGKIGEASGPLLRAKGEATVLGQKMANMNLDLSTSGLKGDASAGISMGLGPLGTQSLTLATHVGITKEKQEVGLSSNVLGRRLNMDMKGDTISVNSPATCLTPVSLSGSVALGSSVTLGDVSKAITGVNVDPLQIAGCTGEALKAAYKWIGTNGAKLGGYTAAAAGKALDGLEKGAGAVGGAIVDGGKVVGEGAKEGAKAAEDAAKASAKAAEDAAKAARDAARNAANAAASAAANSARAAANAVVGGAKTAVNAVGSAVGGSGKKTCNARIEAMRDRQAEAERAGGDGAGLWTMPEPHRIDSLVGQLFEPLLGLVPKGNAYSAHGQALADKWNRADDAFDAMMKRWNAGRGSNPEQRPVNAYLEKAKPQAKVKAALHDLKNKRLTDQIRDASSRGYLKDWVGFRPYTVPRWGDGKSEETNLWHRCMLVHTADVPVRMAQAWKTYLPPTPRGGMTSIYMSPQNYASIRSGVIEHVARRNRQLDDDMTQISQASQDWTHHAADFVRDFLVHAEGRIRPKTRVAMVDPARTAELAPLVKDWNAARLNFKNVLTGTLTLSAIADAKAAAKATDDLIAAAFKLNKAVVADATE